MEIALYIFLGWMFIYWLPNAAWALCIIRKTEDVTVLDIVIALALTAIMGPIVPIKLWIDLAETHRFFDRVVFKKCTKREVWQALGGKE